MLGLIYFQVTIYRIDSCLVLLFIIKYILTMNIGKTGLSITYFNFIYF